MENPFNHTECPTEHAARKANSPKCDRNYQDDGPSEENDSNAHGWQIQCVRSYRPSPPSRSQTEWL